MTPPTKKEKLNTALRLLLSSAERSWWMKAPAVFAAELSTRFTRLSEEEHKLLEQATSDELRDAMSGLSNDVEVICEQVRHLEATIRELVWKATNAATATELPSDDDVFRRFLEINAPLLNSRMSKGGSLRELSAEYGITHEALRVRYRRERQRIRSLTKHLAGCTTHPAKCETCAQLGLSPAEIEPLRESCRRPLGPR